MCPNINNTYKKEDESEQEECNDKANPQRALLCLVSLAIPRMSINLSWFSKNNKGYDDDYDYFRTLNSQKAYSKQKQFVFDDGNKEDIAAKYTYYNENDD